MVGAATNIRHDDPSDGSKAVAWKTNDGTYRNALSSKETREIYLKG